MPPLLHEIKKRIHNPFYLDLNNDYRKTVILSGVGRGGTTWVSEILNFNNDFRYIFEPFKPDDVRLFSAFKGRKYIRPTEVSKDDAERIDRVVRGKIRGFWVDHHNRKLITDRRLIKIIRGNLTLNYIHYKYPEIPIILLLRHPFDVALSHNQRGWNVNFDVHFFNQSELVQDHLESKIAFCRSLETKFEKQIAMWCIENYVPLTQFKEGDIYVAFYEHLIADTENEVKALLEYAKIPYSDAVIEKLKRPSRIIGRNAKLDWGAGLLNRWKEKLTASQIEDGYRILDEFGFKDVYYDCDVPRKEKLTALMKK